MTLTFSLESSIVFRAIRLPAAILSKSRRYLNDDCAFAAQVMAIKEPQRVRRDREAALDATATNGVRTGFARLLGLAREGDGRLGCHNLFVERAAASRLARIAAFRAGDRDRADAAAPARDRDDQPLDGRAGRADPHSHRCACLAPRDMLGSSQFQGPKRWQ
jgi:hypothetical protein